MRPLSDYRGPEAAAHVDELRALGVPVLLVELKAQARAMAADFRTSTRALTHPSLPPLAEALLDPAASLVALLKSDRNPYRNFIFVGRASTCDVVLRDASVSKAHAVFDSEQSTWKLRDNRSHNGTWVDGLRLAANKPTPVAHGSAIVFGAYPAYLIMPDELHRILGTMGPPDA